MPKVYTSWGAKNKLWIYCNYYEIITFFKSLDGYPLSEGRISTRARVFANTWQACNK